MNIEETTQHLAELRQQISLLEKEQRKLDKTTEDGAKVFESNKKQLDSLRKEYKETSKAANELGKTNWQKFKDGAVKAFGSIGSSFKALSTTFVTNPIGLAITAIVAVVTKLVDAFRSSDSAMTTLQRAFAAFQPFIDLFNKGINAVVDGLVSVVSWAGKVAASFATKLGYEDTAKSAMKLVDAMDELEDRMRVQSSINVGVQRDLAKLQKIYSDTTKSQKERNAAAKEYIDLLKSNTIDNITNKLKQLSQGYDKYTKDTGKEVKGLKDVLEYLAKNPSLELTTTQISKISSLLQKIDSDEVKDNLTNLFNSIIRDQTEFEASTRRAEQTLNSLAKTAKETIDETDYTELNESIDSYILKVSKQIKANEDAAGSYIELVNILAKTSYTQDSLNDVFERINSEYKAGKMSVDEYTRSVSQLMDLYANFEEEEAEEPIKKVKELTDSQKKAISDGIEYASAAADIVNQLSDFATQRQKENIQAELDERNQALESEREALDAKLQAGYISEEDYNKKVKELDEERSKAQAEANYKSQLADWKNSMLEAAISTALGIAKAVAQSPFTGGLPGSAIAAALGAVQMGIIGANKPKAPKFATGGLITGPSHKQGGVLLEAEGGEAIINKKSTAKYADLLSAINMAEGGVRIGKFAQGGLINNGGYNAPRVGKMNMPKIYVTVEDINRGQAEYAKVIENKDI